MKKPYLVQRILKKDYSAPGKKGVDALFSFDYMGSAEFEFGALPQALKRMREHAKDLKIETETCNLGHPHVVNSATYKIPKNKGCCPNGNDSSSH